MENKINIPKPCSENWNSMTPNSKGRFCDSCSKTVIDFTKMNTLEIQQYFVENSNKESICGHFKSNQVETAESIKYNNLRNRFNQIRVKPIKIMALFALSFVFTLTSCMGKAVIDGEPAISTTDTINEHEINNKVESTEQQKDSIKKDSLRLKKKE
ncbi:hypothetical protein [Flavobacterium poyangense]|uniref:hypothetical protein n=1 Tax=Flavobacterium poyangense TaxID=2204302 RepID=UPI00141F9E76|nr:hypothetical protein [Flavobacterium sp. JXAS1]